MLLHVPASLDGLLSLFADCFTKPTLQTFRALVVGQVSQTGLRTVCGMLVGARQSGARDHCRAHWSVDELGLRIAALTVERLSGPGAPVGVAIDDTLAHRLGRRVHACFWHHDATANRIEPRSRGETTGRPSKPELARELVDLLAARLAERTIHTVGDAAYAAGAFRGLPKRVSVTSRLRSDAALYELKPPRTGKRGRPRKWGARLPSLAQIALDPAIEWQQASGNRYGKAETLMLWQVDCLWKPLGPEAPVRVILVKDTSKPHGYQLALISTDLDATPAALVERYADRWPIEVCFEEAKHQAGVGDARNRARKAVERTVPFQFLCMTLTIVWYALSGTAPTSSPSTAPAPPGTSPRPPPSFADMLAKLRRVIIAAQYRPGHAHTPTAAEITRVQQAWAAVRTMNGQSRVTPAGPAKSIRAVLPAR